MLGTSSIKTHDGKFKILSNMFSVTVRGVRIRRWILGLGPAVPVTHGETFTSWTTDSTSTSKPSLDPKLKGMRLELIFLDLNLLF